MGVDFVTHIFQLFLPIFQFPAGEEANWKQSYDKLNNSPNIVTNYFLFLSYTVISNGRVAGIELRIKVPLSKNQSNPRWS